MGITKVAQRTLDAMMELWRRMAIPRWCVAGLTDEEIAALYESGIPPQPYAED
jgi:hypothetical protein